jgi:hypothetical protein
MGQLLLLFAFYYSSSFSMEAARLVYRGHFFQEPGGQKPQVSARGKQLLVFALEKRGGLLFTM